MFCSKVGRTIHNVYSKGCVASLSRRFCASQAGESQAAPESKLKSVTDVPTLKFGKSDFAGTVMAVLGAIFPANDGHKLLEEIYRSNPQKLYQMPIPFTPQPLLFIHDPEHVVAMVRSEGEQPVRPGGDHIIWLLNKNGFGTGLVIDNWDTWKTLRSKSNKQVVPRRVLEFTPLIHEVSGDVVQHFKNSRGVNNYVDDVLSPLMDWSFEGIGIFILGERINFFNNPSEKMAKFQKVGVVFVRNIGPMFSVIPWYKYFYTPTSVRFLEAVRDLEEISKELIEEKIAKLSKSHSEGVGFLEQWLLDDKFTMEDMFVLVRDFLAAGIDTTSIVATSMLYELARNPHVQDKLREEVLSVVGEHEVPTVEHLQQLHYCKNIITETLRMHPAVALYSRSLSDDIILEEYLIPKETWIYVNIYTMSRDPSIFDDPLAFNPDRWTRESKKKNAFSYVPFGLGPRACYGRRLAELELNLLLIEMVRNFDLRTDMSEVYYAGVAVLRPTTPVRIQFMIK